MNLQSLFSSALKTTGCKAQFIALSGIFSFGSNLLQYICSISNALAEMWLFWRPDIFIVLASHPFLFNLALDTNKHMHWDLHTGRIFSGLHAGGCICSTMGNAELPCWLSAARWEVAANMARAAQSPSQATSYLQIGVKNHGLHCFPSHNKIISCLLLQAIVTTQTPRTRKVK